MRAPRLALLMLRVQLLNELQYRANLAVQLLQNVIALVIGVITIDLVFDHVDDLDGWSRPQLLVLFGVFTLVGGLLRMIVRPVFAKLVEDVREGGFDFVLAKPVDTQLWVSSRAVDLWQGIDVLFGLGVIVWATTLLPAQIRVTDVVMFCVALLLGTVILYCFLFSLVTTSFWFVRTEEIAELFQYVYQAGRWPMTIYPGWLRVALTFVVPIGLSVSLPADALLSRLSGYALLGELAVAVVFVAFTRWIFRLGIRNYTGASA
ncbi:ABC-2 family transporter protein [Actinomadura sp. B10D3]|uniref:ABC transporter permease n=1 Tax=Actinomadura sp. B10D3 TaxID=3153557 RepID=UPI00325DF268